MKTATCAALIVVFALSCIDFGFALSQKEEETSASETRSESNEPAKEEPLDINTASLQELLLIPNLEDEQVLGIINGRPYETVEELLNVPGIDEPILESIRQWITATPVTEEPAKTEEAQDKEREKGQEEKEKEQEQRLEEKEKEREQRLEEKEKEREQRLEEKEKEREQRLEDKEKEREQRLEEKEKEREKRQKEKGKGKRKN